jgi:hypothetical protein
MRVTLLITFFCAVGLSAFAQSGPPALCKPCLFYGGDLNPSDANADVFYNESTLNDPDTQTFGAITVPNGHTILIEGILFQTIFQETQKLDPKEVAWEIRTGDIFANGGTLVANGAGAVAMQAIGRQFDGGLEYTLATKVSPAAQLTGGRGGTVYWFYLIPLCTNRHDPYCKTATYYVSNTTQMANAFRGAAQPGGLAAINSPIRGYQWAQLCTLGFRGCSWLSFGLMGKVLQ